jgi:hypothetical protein
LSAAGIDACKSLCVASCAQSAIDVFLVLDLGFLIHGYGVYMARRCAFSGIDV